MVYVYCCVSKLCKHDSLSGLCSPLGESEESGALEEMQTCDD